MKTRQIALCLAMILPLNPIIAETVNIDGIWYNLTSKVRLAEVTSNPNGGKYSGSIIIPDTVNYNTIEYAVKSIGVYSFYDCNSLKSVTIPEGVTSIGNDAFAYSSLASISISESVTTIGDKAFRGCSSLKSVTIPEGVTSIGNCVFDGCRNLTTITIPKCVTSIGDDAFHGCHSLKSISIPESVISIGKWTFYECINLTAINIPECITNIGDHAFSHCSSLKSITIPESVTNIRDGIFDCCNNLTSIIIPKNITSIGDNAFFGCSSLTTIILRANKLQSIGSRAFANCSELLDVYCYAETVPSTETNAFEGSYIEYATLHVPTSATESYKNTIPWSGFGKFETISIAVASITLSETSASLTEGESLTLTATVMPNNADDQSISWSSSNPSVATVDNTGKVTAIAAGTATITATANDDSGVSASCEVTVVARNYALTFLVDGEVFYTDSLIRGETITLPEVPTKEGYTFCGWGEVPETMPAEDLTISGTFIVNKYLVTFKIGDEVIASDSLEYGASIVAPEAPAKEGYTFNGWGEVPETMPANDVTISGTFIINKYLVTFKIGDEVIAADSLEYGASIVAPETPAKEGHTFSGWGEVAETVPANDVTYEGSYSVNSYLLTVTVDGETVQADSIVYGTAITLPEAPTKEGHTFSGWSEAPETMPASDVTINGTFTINQYTITYIIDGEVFATDTINYGEAITVPEMPVKEGYDFAWSDEIPETMPAKDLVINGSYTTGILNALVEEEMLYIYTTDGQRVNELQKGINIVLLKDGSIRKLFQK